MLEYRSGRPPRIVGRAEVVGQLRALALDWDDEVEAVLAIPDRLLTRPLGNLSVYSADQAFEILEIAMRATMGFSPQRPGCGLR